MTRFNAKTALVTGAASGIGRATTLALVDGGAHVIAVDRDHEALATLNHPHIITHAFDVGDEAAWRAIEDPIDLAVINAGISTSARIDALDLADWRRTMTVNLDGAFLTMRAAIRAMAGRGGSIVAVSSATGLKAEIGTAAYGASKAALFQLVRVAAKEGAADGIRVNAIAPAGVETPIWRDMPFFQDLIAQHGSEAAAFSAMGVAGTPLGRFATADEIAGQILFLLSDAAATITGATLTSDGGYLL